VHPYNLLVHPYNLLAHPYNPLVRPLAHPHLHLHLHPPHQQHQQYQKQILKKKNYALEKKQSKNKEKNVRSGLGNLKKRRRELGRKRRGIVLGWRRLGVVSGLLLLRRKNLLRGNLLLRAESLFPPLLLPLRRYRINLRIRFRGF
jgi:hypothetical protein